MKIAGFKKQSLIDYPGNISSVVFTQGCNFRCPYCHNPNLVLPEQFETCYEEEELFSYWDKYKHLLDAVCITGGEPCIHKDLPDFISKIKQLGLKVKLDTNGTNPDMLRHLFKSNLVEAVAMDVKHILNFEHYNSSVGQILSSENFKHILKSIELIEEFEIEHEFRTTIAKGLHTIEQIGSLRNRFKAFYTIQNFKPNVSLNKDHHFTAWSNEELAEMNL
ncbi:anaerobic ribonucleoside-triphosphate reductase activating protein [Ancylomarina sp. DW003]|nr:anaerobic ribonucleoside-triphosphate reductase activating protein [Ancylomarina sp. DW003]MDE5424001.1 anaerobic ribonucleoside-triphosphate reductase activating protein [Ancylomarina sp. DW003]